MDKMIQGTSDLRELFFNYSKCFGSYELLLRGVYVDGKTRKNVMIDIDQGKITLNGWVSNIEFENLGGGVYRAFVITKETKGNGSTPTKTHRKL